MNALVLITFKEPLLDSAGRSYTAKICGRTLSDDRWEGWVEFVPEDGGAVLRSRRETTQPNRRAMEGWAERLSAVYLQGSLERTLDMQPPRVPPPPPHVEAPHFDGPSPVEDPGSELAPDDAALNPFVQLRRGAAVLRQELSGLAPSELRTIVRAYHLDREDAVDVDALPTESLVELIVRGTRARME